MSFRNIAPIQEVAHRRYTQERGQCLPYDELASGPDYHARLIVKQPSEAIYAADYLVRLGRLGVQPKGFLDEDESLKRIIGYLFCWRDPVSTQIVPLNKEGRPLRMKAKNRIVRSSGIIFAPAQGIYKPLEAGYFLPAHT
ncbi:MAG TPA: hypothetical protein VK712_00470 [Verrucomicrobiae bacterium]|jgi:hypothetical protein|nr:hypothetical protein [Verrucomicrobiae bacterium]